MNILFLSLSRVTDVGARGIYVDLIREFVRHGHSFYMVKPNERSFKQETGVIESQGVKILGVKTLNIQRTNVVEKGVGTLLLEYQFQRAIKKYFRGITFDLILYSTPPITFNKVIKFIKKRDGAKSYLLLKDIFPQNAVDLGMISKNGLIYKLFRKKERELYRLSDHVGCMSPANVEFILKHNPDVLRENVEVCPNGIELLQAGDAIDRNEILNSLTIPSDKMIFIYGGNLGKPQGVDFLIDVISSNESRDNVYILIVGNGTEYPRLKHWFFEQAPRNAKLLNSLPKDEYDRLIRVCDVGLIFLDRRFTIPNYPSRLLTYLENKIPVLMAIDRNTDIGLIAEQNGYGKWVESGDLDGFNQLVEEMVADKRQLIEMGERGYKFLQDNYTVGKVYEVIMNHFEGNN